MRLFLVLLLAGFPVFAEDYEEDDESPLSPTEEQIFESQELLAETAAAGAAVRCQKFCDQGEERHEDCVLGQLSKLRGQGLKNAAATLGVPLRPVREDYPTLRTLTRDALLEVIGSCDSDDDDDEEIVE